MGTDELWVHSFSQTLFPRFCLEGRMALAEAWRGYPRRGEYYGLILESLGGGVPSRRLSPWMVLGVEIPWLADLALHS